MKSVNVTNSSVPGDLPARLMKEFFLEVTTPATMIYNNIVKSTMHNGIDEIWPRQWKMEYGTPLKKVSQPVDENDLRVISLTNHLSKTFERFVMIWILSYIGHMMDTNQFGGSKGCSVSHYLIEFINFVLFNQDLSEPHAVLAAMVDFSKAFNRVNHNLVITILSRLGIPCWLLKIIASFLIGRELIVRFKGVCSNKQNLPGGGPQG